MGLGTTFGTYAISLPSDTLYNNHLASLSTARIDTLTSSLTDALADKTAIEEELRKLQNTKLVSFGIVIGERNPGHGWRHYPCGTNIDDAIARECRGAIKVTKDRLWDESGDGCGYLHHTVS